ncbi:hypothetical protein A259_28144, partial [Pseudomonas syringae pv. actinidiae ICMP 19070]
MTVSKEVANDAIDNEKNPTARFVYLVINWMSVNGYRADGGGGASCCIIMPTTWRPGLKAQIEWEVDPEPFAKMPSVTSNEFREVY